MLRDDFLNMLLEIIERTKIDFHNDETIVWSLGYKKGLRHMYEKVKDILNDEGGIY